MIVLRNSHIARLVAVSLLITFALPIAVAARTTKASHYQEKDKKEKKDEQKKEDQKKDDKPKLTKEEKEYQKIKKFSLDLYLKGRICWPQSPDSYS